MEWTFVILFALLFIFSVYIGFLAGQAICVRHVVTRRDYWVANIAGLVIAVLVSALLAALPLLYAVAFGALAGYIAGLKMSFGESVGPWKAADKFFNVNKAHRRTAEQGTGEARRRRRKEGGPAPDLISVDEAGAAGKPQPTGTSKQKGSR